MEQNIELEIRLRELACQSLLEARDEIDVLEVEKALLASDQRMNCYASKLEQQRKQLAPSSSSTNNTTWQQTSGNTHNKRQQKCNSSVLSSADSGRGSPSATRAGVRAGTRTDVIGQPQPVDPTYLTLNDINDNNNHSSPPISKLSPVSGQSANSAATQQSVSSGRGSISRTASHSRTNPLKQQQSTLDKRQQQQNRMNGSKLSQGNGQQSADASKKRAKLLLKQQIAQASNINCNIVSNNRATLSISELRIPLMWRDVDHFKGRGDYRRYAIFCLLKINSQIYDTQLISAVDRDMTDVNFDDIIVFHDVEHDFELTLEVYSCVYLEEFSLSSTPRKLKEKLSNSVGRAMGRRLATQTASTNYTRELDAYQDKSYRFTMIASATLHLDDAQDTVKTYDLVLVSPEAHHRRPISSYLPPSSNVSAMTIARGKQQPQHVAWSPWSSNYITQQQICQQNIVGNLSSSNLRDLHKNTLPLFGHFCCKLTVKPDVFDKCVKTGYLRVASIQLPLPDTGQRSSGCSPTDSSGGNNDAATSTSPDSAASTDHNNQSTSDSPQSTLMLRSALAASSKLATMSLRTASVHWALLRNFSLHLWPIDERRLENAIRRNHAPQVDISRRPPFTISIDKSTRLLRVSNSSLTIETDRGCYVFAVYDPYASLTTVDDYKFIAQHRQQQLQQQQQQQLPPMHDEIAHWLRPIEQLIYDSHIWASVLNRYPTQREAAAVAEAVTTSVVQRKHTNARL